MILQINKPEKGDPFFNNSQNGGISTCITGNPTDPGCNVLANCVGGATGAYNKCAQNGKRKWGPILYPPNAENIYKYAQDLGLPTSQKPEPGALIIWRKGGTLASSDGAGHVAFVYKVDPDGTVYTSESEYGGRAWINRSYKPPYYYGTAYTFIGFVLQPRKAVPGGYIKYGDTGSAVVWLQERLQAAAKDNAMFDPGNIDGDFKGKTERALVYFQYKNGLAVDGVAGPATQAALAK